ncbi:MAG: DUF2783 domain-containing protein [Rhodovarius sp.]|nr:DUF2783 domain-containing protein [Rhodovarius sp.]MDW8315465.1 DUF2783 domain-containing protein [Rhodovarius sp.]
MISDPDAFYAALMDAHRGLSPEESRRLDAKLVLILADRIGDLPTLLEAIAMARAAGSGPVADRLAKEAPRA